MKLYNYEQGESEQGEASLTKSFYYILTVKRNSKEFTPLLWIDRQVARVRRLARDIEWSGNYAYELDSCNRLHYHTIISSNKELYFTKFQSKGWNIHFQQFPKEDYGHVIDYFNKCKHLYEGDRLQMETASWVNLTPPDSLYRESV